MRQLVVIGGASGPGESQVVGLLELWRVKPVGEG